MLRTAACLLACALSAAADDAPAPAGGPGWGAEPVEDDGRARAAICLNGLWRFAPGRGAAQPAGWGWIRVPGAWANRGVPLPGVAARGGGAAWDGLDGDHAGAAWNAVGRGWYEREIAVPAAWAGRRIELELERVSTDALVLVDGRAAGRTAWPGGTVDLTALVRPGATALLRVQVDAIGDPREIVEHTGSAADQVFARKSALATRGIIGDVLLRSLPPGGRIADVAIRTSTRQGRIDLDIGVAGAAGELQVAARMLGADGAAERSFAAAATAVDGRIAVGWPWADARRWDIGRPELYTLELEVRGPGIDDALRERFGFREVWIEGRDLWLNGSRWRPRPAVVQVSFDKRICTVEGIDAAIAGFRANGFDSQELWPWDVAERGAQSFHGLWQQRAAEQGFGIFASLISVRAVSADWPAGEAAWTAAVAQQIRRWRNNPAILAWVHSPNMFGPSMDQDPRVLGDRAALLEASDPARIAPGLAAQAIIRRLDPTRPATAHQGGAVGDIQAVNFYPCLQQTQEMEEWLSRYAQEGDMPFWPVEFGPFYLDYRRGRIAGGWGRPQGTIYTELQATEHLAAAYGRAAYAAETPALRALNPGHHQEGQRYTDIYKTWMSLSPLVEAHQGEQLWRIVRAWRALGAPLLPIPWEFELGWNRRTAADGAAADAPVPCAPFVPGLRGCWKPSLPAHERFWLQPRGSTRGPRGDAVARAYAPTVAFIAGPERDGDLAAFTAKDRAFRPGERVEKQAVLINDTRAEQAWSLRWTVRVGDAVAGSGAAAGRLATGSAARVPFACPVPAAGEGRIELEARIGAAAHADVLAIRVLAPAPPPATAVRVVDPAGDSLALLRRLGCRPDDAAPLLVVGRGALSGGAIALEAVRAHAAAGGRVLVLAQDPQWMRQTLGWRVGRQVLRRVFAVDPGHPVMAGLDDADLADWAGAGSLLDPRPRIAAPAKGYPRHGWRWGARGSVCSAMIEKPQRSAWRPILEGDFDLAYTPLMELDLGAGRIVWCTLDLEARGADDPAAERLAGNILRYAAEAAPSPRPGCRIAGAAPELLGLAPRADGALLIAGRGAPRAQIDAHLAAGGSVLCLDADAAGLPTAERADAGGAPAVPDWPWCRGLSPSDLRLRAPLARRVIAGAPAGWEVAADGLLAQRRVGQGLVAVCLLDPGSLPAEAKPYLRLSRWRQVRGLAQIAANLGAGFASDGFDAGSWYLPGWSDDMAHGDDPHRYYRW